MNNDAANDDAVRAWWDAHPCNIRHSTLDPFTRAWSDEIEARKYTVEPHIRDFAQFSRWRGKRVLEVGCGIGTDTINFARHGARVVAIDISARARAITTRRLALNELDAIVGEWIVPWRYDLIYSFGVLHHAAEPEALLLRLRERADDTTELRLMLYTRWSLKWLRLVARHGFRWAKFTEASSGCPVSRVYSFREARALLAAAGFEIVSIRKAHIFPYVVREYVQHRYVKHWWWRAMPPRWFGWLERHFGWHTLIVARVKQ